MKNRRGVIYLDIKNIEDYPQKVLNAFHYLSLIIYRAEFLYTTDSIKYECISPNFRIVNDGEVMPQYEITWSQYPSLEIVEFN